MLLLKNKSYLKLDNFLEYFNKLFKLEITL